MTTVNFKFGIGEMARYPEMNFEGTVRKLIVHPNWQRAYEVHGFYKTADGRWYAHSVLADEGLLEPIERSDAFPLLGPPIE